MNPDIIFACTVMAIMVACACLVFYRWGYQAGHKARGEANRTAVDVSYEIGVRVGKQEAMEDISRRVREESREAWYPGMRHG